MPVRSAALSGEAALSAAMQAAQVGDATFYRALLRDCLPVISAMARAKGVQGAPLDDVVQDTLLTLHRARATYDPARPFLPWLRAITQRRATAIAAALAAFQSSVPGRSAAWSWLPLPPLILWPGASGLGCLRGWLAPAANLAEREEMRGCFVFLMGVSLPLSVLLVLMLRRACPLRPNLTAALGGLAAAAAAAALLVPFHPHDATATDLLVHLVAVLIVVGLNGLFGGRLLDRNAGKEASL